METLVMVRTECCQTYKDTGVRCSICPNRPENKASVEKYRREVSTFSLGRRLCNLPSPLAQAASAAQ
jgi:hypothetical protein